MMKKATILLGAATITLSATCLVNAEPVQQISQLKQTHKVDIEPHWFEIVDSNGKIYDGNRSVDLDTSTIKDVDGGFTIEAKFYGADEYNTGVVNDMKKGETILCNGDVVTVNTIEHDQEGNILVNGGYEKGGITMVPGEGGAYLTTQDNNLNTFENMAEGTVFVSDKTVLIDKSDIENKNGTKYTGAKEIKEFMEKSNKSMDHYNTSLDFENGELKEIDIIYTP